MDMGQTADSEHTALGGIVMRQINVSEVTDLVFRLFIKANYFIGEDIMQALRAARQSERSPLGQDVLSQILENNEIAAHEEQAVCQDTGLAVLFVEYGQDVHVVGGDFEEAINRGVRHAYVDGYLRKSAISDPVFDRKNTQDNTPAIVHTRIVPGDHIRVIAAAKGFGSENMSVLKMLKPSDGIAGIRSLVLDAVREAGPNPCPPVILGVGIGGTVEKAALLAKFASLREVGKRNPDPRYAALEEEILGLVNRTGIGPAGLGGTTTALAVNIEWFPTHITALPVAVNFVCHASRHAEGVL